MRSKWIAVVAMVGVALAAAPVSADGPPGRKWRPFWVAIERDDLRAMNALLAACADERMPGAGDAAKLSAWLEACQDVGVGARNFGETALQAAAEAGSVDVVRALVAAGAEVEEDTFAAPPPLRIATWRGDAEVARVLIEAGADVTRKVAYTPWGRWDLLHLAVEGGNAEVVRVLVEAGADVNAAILDAGESKAVNDHQRRERWDHIGRTPLAHASDWGRADVVRGLLDAGADVDLVDDRGRTALHLAAWKGRADIVRMLLDAGVDVDRASKSGRTALHNAAWLGHAEVAGAFLEAGADIDLVDGRGRTALDFALDEGEPETIEVLRAAGAQ